MPNVTIFRPFSFLTEQVWTTFRADYAPTSLRISEGAQVQTFLGNFTYSAPNYVRGTVNTIEWAVSSALTYRIAGLSAEASLLRSYIKTPGSTQNLHGYVLGGNDRFTATAAHGSVLVGYAGNDSFAVDSARYGLIGGIGRDLADYSASAAAVTVDLAAGTASDAGGSAAVAEIEDLIGTRFADRLTGSDAANLIDGGAGADTLAGGAGDDSYRLDSAADVVIETTDGGFDTVQVSFDYALGAGVEHLTMTGNAGLQATGNALDNRLQGSEGSDRLLGGDGNDTLLGGNGHDTMVGGAGDDEYQSGINGQDTVIEAADGGIDTVIFWGWFGDGGRIDLGEHLERLILGDSTTTEVVLAGNALDNWIEAAAGGPQRLDGGEGRDTLDGGAGRDVYVVDRPTDRIVEDMYGDIDRVESTAERYTLPDHVEQLTLIGDGDIDGKGNELANLIVGNAGANRLDGVSGISTSDTLQGGAGDDVYVLSWTRNPLIVEAAGGGTDTVELAARRDQSIDQAYVLPDQVENLTIVRDFFGNLNGDGRGNALDNTLRGTAGDNRLDGGRGSDTLIGGAGNDNYYVDRAGDVVVEVADGGYDVVWASASYTLGAGVETLLLVGTGAVDGTGNALANRLDGGAGANRLDGGAGADTLTGGAGNDTYVIDRRTDVIREYDGSYGGIDTLVTAVEVSLDEYGYRDLENLELAGTADLAGTGNYFGNRLTGNAGSNRLDGREGADTMSGGAGNDVYIVDAAGDRVIEATGNGIDEVQARLNWTLGGNLEALTMLVSATGIGNALDNRMTLTQGGRLEGRGGNDTLAGFSGTLLGGLGDDVYEVTRFSVSVIERASEGHDTVVSLDSFTLREHLEDLVLTGTGPSTGVGNAQANRITGSAGNNVLDGSAGADTLAGGLGDDRYFVDATTDVTLELSGEGTDAVVARVNWTLAEHFESLRLDGSARLQGHGNDADNLLEGNAGANLLDGHGGSDTVSYARSASSVAVNLAVGRAISAGVTDTLAGIEHAVGSRFADRLAGDAGANRLTGGEGADLFILNSAASADTITDFVSGSDVLQISQARIRVGDGDAAVEAGVATMGDFSSTAELVILTGPIAGPLTAATAAAALGSAADAYASGDRRVFVVNDGADSAVFLFESADSGASIEAAELTQLALLVDAPATTLSDYAWVA